MAGKDEERSELDPDEPDHEPTDAEMDEHVSLYGVDPVEALRAFLRTPPAEKR